MGEDLSHQHPFDVLSDKSRSAAHEARQRHHHTASVNSDMPNPILLAYATTKGAIQNFAGTGGGNSQPHEPSTTGPAAQSPANTK